MIRNRFLRTLTRVGLVCLHDPQAADLIGDFQADVEHVAQCARRREVAAHVGVAEA